MKTFSRTNTWGFSLLETMIALSLFSIGMFGIAGVLISANNGTLYALQMFEATALAEAKLEDLDIVGFQGLGVECPAQPEPPMNENGDTNAQHVPYTRSCTHFPYNGSASMEEVSVKVEWQYRGSTESVVVTTLITQ